jgi:hypothetical protein
MEDNIKMHIKTRKNKPVKPFQNPTQEKEKKQPKK